MKNIKVISSDPAFLKEIENWLAMLRYEEQILFNSLLIPSSDAKESKKTYSN